MIAHFEKDKTGKTGMKQVKVFGNVKILTKDGTGLGRTAELTCPNRGWSNFMTTLPSTRKATNCTEIWPKPI